MTLCRLQPAPTPNAKGRPMTTRTTVPDTSQSIYTELLRLRDQGGQALFLRIGLADKLLSDRDWIAAPEGGGGDESIAIDRLETECFGDVALSLPELLELFHAIPQEAVWKRNKYRVRKMLDELRVRQQARTETARAHRSDTGSTHAPGGGRISETPVQTVERLRSELKLRDIEIKELKERNRKLSKAVKRLTEALESLQIGAA